MKNYNLDVNGYYAEVNEFTKNLLLSNIGTISETDFYKSRSNKPPLIWTINLNGSNYLEITNFLQKTN